MDIEKKIGELRDAVTDADATGLIANEELITEAETRPVLPHADLHASLPAGHVAHGTIDALHAELKAPKPSRGAIETHVHTLRELPELEAAIANWWDDPRTQRFVLNLGQIGL
jgi:hypothetical protein